MLGHDWAVTLTIANRQAQEDLRKHNPDGYLFVTRNVLPGLKELGASQEDVDKIMVDNPRRFFEGQP